MAEEEKKSAPVWMYRGEEAKLFDHPDDVPSGWSDSPATPVPAPKKRKAKEEQPEPMEEELNDDGS